MTSKRQKSKPKTKRTQKLLKLDLGCGGRKVGKEWVGVDSRKFKGVDLVFDLAKRVKARRFDRFGNRLDKFGTGFKRWPWKSNSVDEIHSSHFVEHLDAEQRVHFVNEMYRVLKPGAKAHLTCPNWSTARAYGDLTHQMPPISVFWFQYLRKEWRDQEAPHNDFYTCDFAYGGGFVIRPDLVNRDPKFKDHARDNYIEATPELITALTKL